MKGSKLFIGFSATLYGLPRAVWIEKLGKENRIGIYTLFQRSNNRESELPGLKAATPTGSVGRIIPQR